MSSFYSPSTGSIYFAAVHALMPDDVIPIDAETIDKVIANPPMGKMRAHRQDGTPYLVDLVLTHEEVAALERAWRDSVLAQAVWLRDRHRDQLEIGGSTTLTAEQFQELLVYMQSLRDWPQSNLFPDIEQRPAAPLWIAEQRL